MPIAWNDQNRGFTFFGIDSVIYWNNPSLVSILTPLRNELGSELYSLLISYASSKGTYEDYHSLVTTLGQSFEEGFINWGKAVSGAGWGTFSILSLNWEKKEAIIQIDDPWEMKIFKSEHPQDSAPFLKGKISGIFTHAFRTNCRSKITEARVDENGMSHIILNVHPSVESLEVALHNIQNQISISPQEGIKAINSALRQNQQRLLDLMNTVGAFVWETDIEMVINYVTNTCVSILGLTPEKLLGNCFFQLIHKDDVGTFQETNPNQHKFVAIKMRIWTGPGKLMWVGCNVKALYDFSGNHSGCLGVGQDITNQIQLEAQLQEQRERSIHSAKMAALGEKAGGIGHELNNPLAVISANVWQLQSSIQENLLDLERLKKTLGTIQDTTHRMRQTYHRNAIF